MKAKASTSTFSLENVNPSIHAVGMSDPGEAASASGPISRSNIARVGTATVLTAICIYAVIYLAARFLPPATFSAFSVFWGALGIATGTANGLLHETTRTVRSVRYAAPAAADRIRPVLVAGAIGVIAAIAVAATSGLWSRYIFADARSMSVWLLCIGLTGFCVQAGLLGVLAGNDCWTLYGILMTTDAVARVVVAAAAALIGWGLSGFLVASSAGAAAWLILLILSPTTRDLARQLTAVALEKFLRGVMHSVAAAGASAILLVGFPVLLMATSDELGTRGGVIILAITVTRAPLLVPMSAMQGNLIAHFVDYGTSRLHALIIPAVVVSATGAAGVLVAGLAGPQLLRVGFGNEYDADGELLAWLTAAAVVLAMLALTGAAAIAAALHRAYSLGWVTATIAATLSLLLPTPLESRTVIALICGPLVGIAIHLVALARLPR